MVEYTFVIGLINYITITTMGMFSTYYFGRILLWFCNGKFPLGINFSMQFYIFTEFVFSLCCVVFGIYFTAFWRGDTNIYHPYLVFGTFAPLTVAAIIGPIATCFLGFERCLCLMFPLKKWQISIFVVSIIASVVAAAITINFVVLIALPLPETSNCRVLSCLASGKPSNVYLIFRHITGVGSVIIGVALMKLSKMQKNLTFSNRITRLAVSTLSCAILLDFIPHFVTYCLSNIWLINVSYYIGPYSFLSSSINTFVCGFLYFKAMKKFVATKTVTVLPKSTTDNVRK